jgi:hypothetical protein
MLRQTLLSVINYEDYEHNLLSVGYYKPNNSLEWDQVTVENTNEVPIDDTMVDDTTIDNTMIDDDTTIEEATIDDTTIDKVSVLDSGTRSVLS